MVLKGFRDFIMRGNVIDLAVAVVIGAAFTAVVTAIVENVVNPLVRVVMGGSEGELGGTWTISGQTLDFAAVITALITFVVTAAVVYFVFVAPMNKAREIAAKRRGETPEDAAEPEEIVLLREIRDSLKERGPGPQTGGA